jgi:MinD-like ATPase involved in chromosome partitioning or flagellar assembly
MALEGRTFTATVSRTRRFYQLALIDCGAEIEHPMFPAVLSASDALMIVGSCSVEGGLAVETTIDWLAARNGHELLKRSVVVLNDAYRSASTNFITHVTETLGKRVHSVKTVPWDAHLRDAPTLDFPALRRRTQLAFIELAAELAGGFPTAGALAG